MAELECLPFGVGQHSEGICLQVRLGPYWLLLDCGLKDLRDLIAVNKSVRWAGLMCSHAHNDHGRSIPSLHAIAPEMPIYTSEVTAKLLPLIWSAPYLPTDEFLVPLAWGIPYQIQPDLFVQILPSGHLPGAASFLLSYEASDRKYTILYTGDFFLSNSRLTEGLSIEHFRGLMPDVLIVEGSFGVDRHPHRRKQENLLVATILQALAAERSVLLPVPKLGLGQEILMLLRSHHQFTGKDIDIWVDNQVGLGCDRYLEILDYLPNSVQNFAQHQSLFWDYKVRPRIGHLASTNLTDLGKPSVVLADRDTDWYSWLQSTPHQWLVLDCADEEYMMPLRVDLETDRIIYQTYLLAEHSDVAGTAQLIHNLKPQHVVFVHGSPSRLSDLANLEELSNRYHVHCASAGKKIELPVGSSLNAAVAGSDRKDAEVLSPYEGELAELDSTVMLTLPIEITEDRRWLNFADTGLVEAKWQGDNLVIRGISQRELLNAETLSATSSVRSCVNCRFYRDQHCQNRESPLRWLRVNADGYCPAFQADADKFKR
ncbi:MBL fold metallo-hydrolase [Pseudanabaena sp. PCC 6802]|uniref:MBL fold metallo-hydrolase n=1 Tax=Pseudanabaena sp. PCC 6802 TaxID=118173 RepID=UPI000347D08B|nr:MBL fold metallo-hydrolase [Pseudanabaena sp. PCC 6802]